MCIPSAAPAAGPGLYDTSPGLARIDADGTGLQVLVDGVSVSGPVTSPAGDRVAWIERRPGVAPVLKVRSGTTTTSSAPLPLWTSFGFARNSAFPTAPLGEVWSPDGTKLVLGREHDAIVATVSGAATTYAADPGGPLTAAFWSPDSRYVALTGLDDGLALIDTEAGTRLTIRAPGERVECSDTVCEVGWSPDSTRLVYLAGAVGATSAVLVGVDGGGRRALAAGAERITRARWSPTGTHLALVRQPTAGQAEVIVESAAGTGRQVLGAPAASVEWSPDGTRVLVDGNRIVLADGTAVATLAAGTWQWSPDGQRLGIAGPTLGVRIVSNAGAAVATHSPGVAEARDLAWAADSSAVRAIVRTQATGALPELVSLAAAGALAILSGPEGAASVVWNPTASRAYYEAPNGQRWFTTGAGVRQQLTQEPIQSDSFPLARRAAWLSGGEALALRDGEVAVQLVAPGQAPDRISGGEVHRYPAYTRIAPDDRRIALVRAGATLPNTPDERGVWIVDRRGPAPVRVLSVADAPALATAFSDVIWSPTAQHLLVEVDFRRWVFPATGGPGVVLQGATDGGVGSAAEWSPDGSRLVVRFNTPGGGTGVRIVTPDGATLVSIPPPALGSVREIGWSPDGTSLAYSVLRSTPSGAASEVRVVGRDGTGDRLVASLAGSVDPGVTRIPGGSSWSPDQRHLVIANGGLKVLALTGGATTPLLAPGEGASALSADWSVLGAVVYMVDTNGQPGPEVARAMAPDGSDRRLLGAANGVLLSPDGRSALLARFASNPVNATVVSLVGEPAPVSFGDRLSGGCYWSPDGRRLWLDGVAGAGLVDVPSLALTAFPRAPQCLGWSPAGDLFLLGDGSVRSAVGASSVATNLAVDRWAPGVPVVIAGPALAGDAVSGFTATLGLFGSALPGRDVQWMRCDAAGAACQEIPGATGPSHTPSAADGGRTIRARVTARSAAGATSALTPTSVLLPGAPVTAAPGTGSAGGPAGIVLKGPGLLVAGVRSLATGRGGLVAVLVRCPSTARARCAGTLTIQLPGKASDGLGKAPKIVVLGQRRFSIARGRTAAIAVTLNVRGRALLGKLRTLRVLIVSTPGAGTPMRATLRAVTLRLR